MPPIPGRRRPEKKPQSGLIREPGPLKKWICPTCEKAHYGFKREVCRNKNCKSSPFYVESKNYICTACEGSGEASRGGKCPICKGTGKLGKR